MAALRTRAPTRTRPTARPHPATRRLRGSTTRRFSTHTRSSRRQTRSSRRRTRSSRRCRKRRSTSSKSSRTTLTVSRILMLRASLGRRSWTPWLLIATLLLQRLPESARLPRRLRERSRTCVTRSSTETHARAPTRRRRRSSLKLTSCFPELPTLTSAGSPSPLGWRERACSGWLLCCTQVRKGGAWHGNSCELATVVTRHRRLRGGFGAVCHSETRPPRTPPFKELLRLMQSCNSISDF
mmetsp:Transcript_17813/g.46082  ORF Transcript_17813/g.46082 Transcript_17813/m.46082 type:complete len:240 (-) Transcript_17813:35-754(-)